MPIGQSEGARTTTTGPQSGGFSLDDSLQYMKGVGPQVAAALAKLGLLNVSDLLRHVPRRWEDRTDFRRVAEVRNGELVTVRGLVIAASTTYPKPRFQVTKVLLDDEGDAITLTWFNQSYYEQTFKRLAAARKPVVVYGQAKRNGWTLEIQNPEWEELSEDGDSLSVNRVVPIYPATEGVSQKRLRRMVDSALQTHLALFDETLPPEVVLRHRLIGAQRAWRNIHFPESLADLEAARRRIIFEEFFHLQTLLALRRRANSHEAQGIPFRISLDRLREELAQIVPFTLTGAQQRAIAEIAADMQSGRAMNRLCRGMWAAVRRWSRSPPCSWPSRTTVRPP